MTYFDFSYGAIILRTGKNLIRHRFQPMWTVVSEISWRDSQTDFIPIKEKDTGRRIQCARKFYPSHLNPNPYVTVVEETDGKIQELSQNRKNSWTTHFILAK